MNTISTLPSALAAPITVTKIASSKPALSAPASVIAISSEARQTAAAASGHGSSNIIWGSAPTR